MTKPHLPPAGPLSPAYPGDGPSPRKAKPIGRATTIDADKLYRDLLCLNCGDVRRHIYCQTMALAHPKGRDRSTKMIYACMKCANERRYSCT